MKTIAMKNTNSMTQQTKRQKHAYMGRNFETRMSAEGLLQAIEEAIENALQESIKLLDLDFFGLLDNTSGRRARMLYVYLRYMKAAITNPAQTGTLEKWFCNSNRIVKQLLDQTFGNHSFNKAARLNIWAIGLYMDRINAKITKQGINQNAN